MTGRADDRVRLRGIGFFPVRIDKSVRAVPATGSAVRIHPCTQPDGLDGMRVTVEHADPAAKAIARDIPGRCQVRRDPQGAWPDTPPKSPIKAGRVFDERGK